MLAPRVATEREGRFTPVLRSRVLERIARAARYPIAVIAAPAGYGKTVALRQYLDSINGPVVRYDLRASESTLLGFIRGFAHAFAEFAPDLAKTVISAYESNHSSPTCAADLAQWMHAHIKDFDGLVAIDDLHVAQDEPRVDEFLSRLIDLTKQKTSWLLASRGVGALPVASWIAYGDMEFVIDERDLRMTLDEAQSVAHELAPGVDEAELKALLGATDAWPTALSFALRSSTNVGDLREAAATSRDLLYRYLAEQVYRSLEPRHIELLHFIAQLQEIDVEVLRCAGFERPEASLDELHARTGFLYPEGNGLYRCHDLFRDFLRHQLALHGREAVRDFTHRSANALELSGRISAALEVYARIPSQVDVLRLLRAYSLDLLDEAQSEPIRLSLSVVSKESADEPIVLALLGLREVDAGHFRRAEALLSKAACTVTDRELSAELSIRLGRVLFNQHLDVRGLLEPVAHDLEVSAPRRMHALSFLAPSYAAAGERSKALSALTSLEEYASTCNDRLLQARILHRSGIAAIELGLPQDRAAAFFSHAAAIAKNEGLYLTAAAAIGGLQTIIRIYEDDTSRVKMYAEEAMSVALRSGDRFALQTALLQAIDVETWLGNVERLQPLASRFSAAAGNDSALGVYFLVSCSLMEAWDGDFESAYNIISALDVDRFFDFDRGYARALHALYAARCGFTSETKDLVDAALALTKKMESNHLHAHVLAEITRALCAVGEACCGRFSAARRILSRAPAIRNARVQSIYDSVVALCQILEGHTDRQSLNAHVSRLYEAETGGVARLLVAVLGSEFELSSPPCLTTAELDVLRCFAQGQTAKEIAAATSRSVHTVRTLSQRAIGKLGCSGRQQAIYVAQERGLI
jgi:ATP/maltotriose-dependent transcriptional regulator MalT